VQIACDAGALADAGLQANVELITSGTGPHLIEGHEQSNNRSHGQRAEPSTDAVVHDFLVHGGVPFP
jgi:hypothetical protein